MCIIRKLLHNLDDLRRWIELISPEAKNHTMFRLVAYVLKDSPKLKILAYIAHLIYNVHYRRHWVFEDWLLIQWNLESILYLSGSIVTGQFNFRA